jgi:hypothetical protein
MILRIDSRIDVSLPYLVYITKTAKEISPITRKIQARTHNVREGRSIIADKIIFIICMFRYIIFFFNFINE